MRHQNVTLMRSRSDREMRKGVESIRRPGPLVLTIPGGSQAVDPHIPLLLTIGLRALFRQKSQYVSYPPKSLLSLVPEVGIEPLRPRGTGDFEPITANRRFLAKRKYLDVGHLQSRLWEMLANVGLF